MSSRTEHSHFGDEEHPDEVYDQEWIEDPHPVDDGEPIDEHVVHEDLVHEEPVHEDDGLHADLLGEPEHVEDDIDIFGTRRPAPAPPRTRSQARVRHAASRKADGGGKFRSIGLPLIALAVIVALGFGAYKVIVPKLTGVFSNSAEDYPGPGSGEATIVVHPGDTGSDIARELLDAGVIASTAAFVDASRQDPDAAATIQPGQYTLLKEMKAADALAALTDANNRYIGERVTLREGLWKSEVFAALSQATGVPVADYEAAAADGAALGLPESAEGNIEGWMFPATYTLKTDDSAVTHLKTLVDEMKKQLQDAGAAEEDWQRVLVIASIVEGEARANVDLGKVARVVENRLADPTGPTVGFLQMDSTVNYVLQKRGNLTKSEYDSAKSDPYDTYAFKGLPPGPIGNPGRAAIDAAVNPTEGEWFYFVTINLDTGETLFAETFEEHQRNDAQRVQWCQDNPGKCTGGG